MTMTLIDRQLSSQMDEDLLAELMALDELLARQKVVVQKAIANAEGCKLKKDKKDKKRKKKKDNKVEATTDKEANAKDTTVEDTKVEETKVDETKVEDTKVENTKVADANVITIQNVACTKKEEKIWLKLPEDMKYNVQDTDEDNGDFEDEEQDEVASEISSFGCPSVCSSSNSEHMGKSVASTVDLRKFVKSTDSQLASKKLKHTIAELL